MAKQQTVDDIVSTQRTISVPDQVVTLELVSGTEIDHSCGDRRLRAFANSAKLKPKARRTLTERCYLVPPGATVELEVGLRSNRGSNKVTGPIYIEANRGKLSSTRVEVKSAKPVRVEFTAPDETVKISIRAFADGFHRGKVHLHLSPEVATDASA